MFVGNHIIYHDLLIYDMRRIETPADVNFYIKINESFSRTGDPNLSEGCDYIIENENYHLKSHLSPRVPTLKHLEIAAHNHKLSTENRILLFERIGMKDPSSEDSSIFRLVEEIVC